MIQIKQNRRRTILQGIVLHSVCLSMQKKAPVEVSFANILFSGSKFTPVLYSFLVSAVSESHSVNFRQAEMEPQRLYLRGVLDIFPMHRMFSCDAALFFMLYHHNTNIWGQDTDKDYDIRNFICISNSNSSEI